MITIENLHATLYKDTQLSISELTIKQGQSWAFIGSNGSGKSAFSSLFNNELTIKSGHLKVLDNLAISIVSFEEQQRLIDREKERDDSDITNIVFEGTPVMDLFSEVSQDQSAINNWVEKFNLKHVIDKGFRKLSTGESRKVIIIRALLQTHDLLVFDEPFDGLDAQSQQHLYATLTKLHQQNQSMILILNRLDEVPEWVQHMGFLHNCQLLAQGEKNAVLESDIVKAFLTFNNQALHLPERDGCAPKLNLDSKEPLVTLNNGKVAYSDRLIFEKLNWTIQQGEHWVVLGPNGCGKSTLLNLISGDHPQCYANDLTVFGIKRGSGESIWDIKQHIGIISSAYSGSTKPALMF